MTARKQKVVGQRARGLCDGWGRAESLDLSEIIFLVHIHRMTRRAQEQLKSVHFQQLESVYFWLFLAQVFPHQPAICVVLIARAPLVSWNVRLLRRKGNCWKGNGRVWGVSGEGKGREGREQIIKGYKRRKEWQKREGKERTSLPFGAKRGPIDSGVMSLVLAGVQRDRSGAGGGRRGGRESRDLIPNSKQHHFCRHQNQHLSTPIKARWPSARLMTNPA